MCGRYTMSVGVEALAARFHAEVSASMLSPNYNAAPSQGLPAILDPRAHLRKKLRFHWGSNRSSCSTICVEQKG